jgi:hypothetical protein
MTVTLLIVYGTAGLLFAGHALLTGVARARRGRYFTLADGLILGGVALLAGALWGIFAPPMAARALGAGAARWRGAARPSTAWGGRREVHAHS